MIDVSASSKILVEALPYIQKFFGKIIVIKYGGNAMIDAKLQNSVMRDAVLLSTVGMKVVLVHGGGPDISSMLKKVGKESKFINGLRYTDEETAEIVGMVLAGKVNKELVAHINTHNGKAIGLSGIDGQLIRAKKHVGDGDVDLGFVGEVESVNSMPILMALENGFIPVVATVGCDETGQIYNINADTAAAAIAGALDAEKLIAMTDIRGLLKDKDDEDTLISKVNCADVPRLIDMGIISGGMIPKIQSCVYGIESGVKEAVIIDGRIEHSILIELLSDKGIGTLFSNYIKSEF